MAGTEPLRATRRDLLAGAGGLVIAISLPLRSRAQAPGGAPFAPNAFLRVGADNIITVLSRHIEFGQGPWTGLATLVAEEMDAAWDQIAVEHAPSDPELYANPLLGMQITGGSTSMATSFDVMRKAGAGARAMLLSAAGKAWGVAPGAITVDNGRLSHPSGKSGVYGEFADAAAQETLPDDPPLKSPDQFVYIGKSDLAKIDTHDKSTGAATFTLDVYRDAMATAVVAHPTKFGARPASVDDADARAVAGVIDVKMLSGGVAVYGETTYAALKGRKALSVAWDETAAETRSTEKIAADSLAVVKTRGAIAGAAGDVDAGLADAQTVIDADYVFPYLAHAPMEPLDAVIERNATGGVDAWLGSQSVTGDHQAIATVCGLEMDQVNLKVMLAGGSFGRRATVMSEFAAEAAEAFMALGGARPVKTMWTREDDIQGGFYRPLTAHRMRGGLDADGAITTWEHVIAGQSFASDTPFEGVMIRDGVDTGLVEGASTIPYTIENFSASNHILKSPVPVLWWRSVGHTHTGYAVETFIDELLEAGGRDAVAGRLALMEEKNPRLAATLVRAAEMADWPRARGEGRALGVASVESFGSYVSQVADVSIERGAPRVHKVWCAVDCGLAVNPDIVKAQMEGGVGYGLGAILFDEITLGEDGAVMQSNFHDYRSLRIDEMPEVAVAIMASDAPPTGVGEPGTPPIGPAVANAVRRLTGNPVRRLPMIRGLSA